MNKCKSSVAVVLGFAGALVASASQAQALQWSITVGTPRIVYPVPVYSQPLPVVVPSEAILLPRAARVQVHQVVYGTPTRWDADGDGIPNRRDRLYNPRWDRDGDGVPNRHDRRDQWAWRGR